MSNINERFSMDKFFGMVLLLQIFLWDLLNYFLDNLPLYLSFLIFLVLFAYKRARVMLPRSMIMLFLLLLLHGTICIAIGNTGLSLFARQFIGTVTCLSIGYIVIDDIDLKWFIRTYIKMALIVSLIAIIQWFVILAGGNWPLLISQDYGERITSIYAEPSYFAMIICPVLYLCLECIINKENPYDIKLYQILLLLVAYMLTLSTIAYAILAIAALICIRNNKRLLARIAAIIVLLIGLGYVYYNVEGVGERINSLIESFGEDNVTIVAEMSSNKVHGTSGIWTVNFNLGVRSFSETLGFGGGLGSHVITSAKYLTSRNVNAEDACSLFIRLMSELGVFGLCGLVYFIYVFRVKENECENVEYALVSNFALVEVIGHLIRQGNYFWGGFGTFICLYYFAYIKTPKENKDEYLDMHQ